MSPLPAAAGQATPRGTGITFYVCELRSGLVLDELPLKVEQLADTVAREESQEFTLDVYDEACPDDWHSLLVPGKHMLVAVNTEQQPVMGWAVLGTELEGPQVSISCATLEHCLARVNVDTVEAYETDEGELARLVANKMTTTHGFTVSAGNTGQTRDAYYVAEEEDRSVYDALAELMAGEGGPEWHIKLDWAPGPWQVIGTNLAKNPSFTTDTSGWSHQNGTGGAVTATRETAGGVDNGPYRRLTWTTGTTAVGGGHQTTTTSMGQMAITPGAGHAASIYLRSNRAQTVRVSFIWRDAANANIGTTSGASIPLSPNVWTRLSVANAVPPAGATYATIIAVAVAGGVNWQAGDTLDADQLLVEASGTVVNAYYDGSTTDTTTDTYAWTGTAHASTSTRSTRAASRQYLVKIIEIAQRIGIDRPDVVFELDADGVGNIASYSRNIDYTSDRGATFVWAGAEGAGESRPLSQKYTSDLVTSEGWPTWEARPQITGLDKPTILNPDAALERRARAELARRERGARVWALEGDADSPRPVHDFAAGDIVYVDIAPQGKRDPEGGVFAARVIAWTWDLNTGAVTPEVWEAPDGDQMTLNIDPRMRPPRGLREVWEQIKRNNARLEAKITSPSALGNTQVDDTQSFTEWKQAIDEGMALAAERGLNWRGVWSPGTAYAVNDAVTQNGSTWRRTVAGTTPAAPSTDPANWELVAAKGDTGPQGEPGPQGIPGPPGADGQTLYTWLKYADTPTTGMADDPTGKTYMGLAYNKTSPAESSTYSDYSWSLIKGADGAQGVPGPPGADGQPTYTWVKYGTSAAGAGLSDDPTGKTYIGLAYNKTTATESTNPADYTWALIQGPQGPQGPQGETGPQGPQGNVGPIGPRGLTWRGTYNGATAYSVDDAVYYNGSSYRCIVISTGNLPTNTTYWTLLAQQGATGSTGSPGTPGGMGDGLAPAGSPAATVYPAIGALAVTFTPLVITGPGGLRNATNNPDATNYEIHVSTSNPPAGDATTKVAEYVAGSPVFVRNTAAGAALVQGTNYYVGIRARDVDGLAAMGTVFGPVQLGKADAGDVTVNALVANNVLASAMQTADLTATTITGVTISAATITGSLYKTAASGSRVELGANPASASTDSSEIRVYHASEGVGSPALRIKAVSTGMTEYVANTSAANQLHRFLGDVEVSTGLLWALSGLKFRSGGQTVRGIDVGEFSGNTTASQKVSPSHTMNRVPLAVVCIPTNFRSSYYHAAAPAEFTTTTFTVYPRLVTTGALPAAGTNVNFLWIAIG